MITYITVKQSPSYHQMTLEELLFSANASSYMISSNVSNTRTYITNNVSKKLLESINIQILTEKLNGFNQMFKSLREVPRESLYNTFHIPKKSGGLRRIDAPNDELMTALRTLKLILEDDFHALYHTSAFAYVKNRSTIDAVKRHQSNQSRWFAKYDLKDFFGNTTLDFTIKMLSMIFPFSELMMYKTGEEALRTALDLAFLNGGLPQGTPISPLITNLIMIPIDYELSNKLRDFNKQNYVYTRYADDFLISSKFDFNPKIIESLINDTLKKFNAPFCIKPQKTRYGSSAGSNWNLGVMLNKDNEITVGHKKKRAFQAMLHQYIMDKKNGNSWDLNDVMTMQGYYAYYRMVEGETIDRIVAHINEKFGVNVLAMIKNDLMP